MNNPICFALDGMGPDDAQRYVNLLEEHVGAFKVGLELFIRSQSIPLTHRPIVLDLKLHDIPETVAGAVRAGGELGVRFMTLHVQQRKALEAAVRAAEPFNITLLGVTVLTSMDDHDLSELGCHPSSAPERVVELARFAVNYGLRGLVCSPREVRLVRSDPFLGRQQPFLLVPGTRPAGSASNDQKRTGSPGQAVRDGASLLVVGRPIRDAQDPVLAVQDIIGEISNG